LALVSGQTPQAGSSRIPQKSPPPFPSPPFFVFLFSSPFRAISRRKRAAGSTSVSFFLSFFLSSPHIRGGRSCSPFFFPSSSWPLFFLFLFPFFRHPVIQTGHNKTRRTPPFSSPPGPPLLAHHPATGLLSTGYLFRPFFSPPSIGSHSVMAETFHILFYFPIGSSGEIVPFPVFLPFLELSSLPSKECKRDSRLFPPPFSPHLPFLLQARWKYGSKKCGVIRPPPFFLCSPPPLLFFWLCSR